MTSSDVSISARAGNAQTPGEFHAPYAPGDETIAAELLKAAERTDATERRIDTYAARLIQGIRARTGGLGGIEDFLHAYSLSTTEGLALMCSRRRCCGSPTRRPPTG